MISFLKKHILKWKSNTAPNQKIILIHIGAYKTATSFIQNSLQINREYLLKKANVHYVQTGLTKSGITGRRHLLLAKAIEQGDTELFNDLADEIKSTKANYYVISSEYLSRFSLDQIQNLKSMLPNLTVKVLFTVRRQDEFIESMYAEYTQHNGNTLGAAGFIQQMSTLLNYKTSADHWAITFGKQAIIVSEFEANKAYGLMESFFRDIGIDESLAKNLEPPEKTNSSIGEKPVNLCLT